MSQGRHADPSGREQGVSHDHEVFHAKGGAKVGPRVPGHDDADPINGAGPPVLQALVRDTPGALDRGTPRLAHDVDDVGQSCRQWQPDDPCCGRVAERRIPRQYQRKGTQGRHPIGHQRGDARPRCGHGQAPMTKPTWRDPAQVRLLDGEGALSDVGRQGQARYLHTHRCSGPGASSALRRGCIVDDRRA